MVSPRQVVIDDTDTQIHYTGSGWFLDQGSQDHVGNFGPTYKKTSHGTKGNDSFSFSFDGSSVTVYGTTSLKTLDNWKTFNPKWECFVDGISIGATKPFQFAENNWSLCEQGTIADGPHVITVNVTTTGNTFWFDYLMFTPSPRNSSATLLVQNTDPAILYDHSWRKLGGTANITTKIGSVMNFDFVGTSLTWVSFIPTELPHNESTASYSIDNGPLTRFKLAGLPPTADTSVYFQVFFVTPDLPIGHHTIMVTYEGSNVPSTPLTLDYLLVADAPLPVAANANSSGTSSVPTPSTTPHPGAPIGPIIGGVVGGLAIIAILLFAFWWRRQPRALHVKSNNGLTGARNTQIVPNTNLIPRTIYTAEAICLVHQAPPYQRATGEVTPTSIKAYLIPLPTMLTLQT
ncbi:hypothetical protein C0993_012485 [Termitomyces sp. T159_Od127]|nr:hypothetical protein C0993_012485 [Termitomyces sp. T159_Od127]